MVLAIPKNKSARFILSFLFLLLLSGTARASASSNSPLMPSSGQFPLDLDVTYIERTPRYPRLLQCKAGKLPIDYPCPSPQRDFPDPGEPIEFRAHVLNKGYNQASQFDFVWSIDDVPVKQGKHVWTGAEQAEALKWNWLTGPHRVRFAIIAPQDSFTGNNFREVRTDASALSIFVEQGQYDVFEQRMNLAGSLSFEDWIQAQSDRLNTTFVNAVYPTTPNGLPNRVRIDKIVVAPEMDGATPNSLRIDPDEFLNDGRWLFSDGDPTNSRGYGNPPGKGSYVAYADSFATKIDWGLLHELGHQLGRFDMYNIDFDPAHNLITGPNGLPLKIGHLAHYGYGKDIMEDPGSGVWSEYHAASFLRDYGDRRGLYGEYIYDVPAQNTLRLVDGSGRPAVGAGVSVYRDQYEKLTDDSLYLRGTTDAAGELNLGAAPFGALDHNAVNATLFISATIGSSTEYHWLEVTAFNLAFWRGHQDQATFTLALGAPDNSDLELPDVLAPDTTPPEVSLESPADGSALVGLVSLGAAASDNRGIKRVEIMADGRTIAVFARPPYVVSWDTAQLIDGSHEIWARAYDTALPANVADSPHFRVSVDNAEHHVFSWDFNRDDDYDAWDLGWNDVPTPAVTNGSLRIVPPTGDPGARRWLPVGLTTWAGQTISLRMRISGGGSGVGTVYWTTYADPAEDESKAIYFQVSGDGAWSEYRIPVSTNPLWLDRIRTLRIDPVSGIQYIGSTVEIDWIRIAGPRDLFFPLISR